MIKQNEPEVVLPNYAEDYAALNTDNLIDYLRKVFDVDTIGLISPLKPLEKRGEFKSVTKVLAFKETYLTIRELLDGYCNNDHTDEGGVTAMNNRLEVRPKFQRGYCYADKYIWKEKIMYSMFRGELRNKIYITPHEEITDPTQYNEALKTGKLDVVDGQQRIITICEFIKNNYTIDGVPFHNLPDDIIEKIYDIRLPVEVVFGTKAEVYKFFSSINTTNTTLSEMELINSQVVGDFTESLKKYFCTHNKFAKNTLICKELSRYNPKRYFHNDIDFTRCDAELVAVNNIAYITMPETRNMKVRDRVIAYMTMHCNDANANETIEMYQNLCDWIRDMFWHGNQEMFYMDKGKPMFNVSQTNWAKLYVEFGNVIYTNEDKERFSKRCLELIESGEIERPHNVFEYVLRGEGKINFAQLLQSRRFGISDKDFMWKRQGGECPITHEVFSKKDIGKMDAHHIIHYLDGGITHPDNGVLLSKEGHKKAHNPETAASIQKMLLEYNKKFQYKINKK